MTWCHVSTQSCSFLYIILYVPTRIAVEHVGLYCTVASIQIYTALSIIVVNHSFANYRSISNCCLCYVLFPNSFYSIWGGLIINYYQWICKFVKNRILSSLPSCPSCSCMSSSSTTMFIQNTCAILTCTFYYCHVGKTK